MSDGYEVMLAAGTTPVLKRIAGVLVECMNEDPDHTLDVLKGGTFRALPEYWEGGITLVSRYGQSDIIVAKDGHGNTD